MLLDSQKTITRGIYSVTVIIGTGTAVLQQSVDGSAFVAIPDASWSASTVKELTLPNCELKPVLGGDAVVHVNMAVPPEPKYVGE